MKEIRHKERCSTCSGTGVHSGRVERDNSAIVCHQCKGTGCYEYVHKFVDFTERVKRDDVARVYATNPGICIGTSNGHALSDFGGMPYSEWDKGKPFPPKSENRLFTCPAWWYQAADYDRKPKWSECLAAGAFPGCDSFDNKAACWDRWDKENK